MLQSNSCNYVQSVDNQGLAERLLAHKHGIRKEASRATAGRNISVEEKKNGFESVCEKLTIKELLSEAFADVRSNRSR